MTREQAKELLPIIQAFADGKKIETRYDIYDWTETEVLHLESNNEYRIKPEPKYRPFRTQEECWNEMHKHPDFGWLKDKENGSYVNIVGVSKTSGNIPLITFADKGFNFIASVIFGSYTYTDGTPFGIKED